MELPTWIGAIGTLALAVLALIAGRAALGQLREMRTANEENHRELGRVHDREAEQDYLRARSQAENVELFTESYHADLAGLNYGIYPTVTVKNGSKRPIRSLRCFANMEGGDRPTAELSQYIGSIERDYENDPEGFIFVSDARPDYPVQLVRRGESRTFLLAVASDRPLVARFWVQFQDDADLWWSLEDDMRLRQINAEELWP